MSERTVNRLRDDVDEINALAGATQDWLADRRGWMISIQAVEKDFWLIEVLRSLAEEFVNPSDTKGGHEVNAHPVFKSGTSLSKAYGYIERLSEDFDVYLDLIVDDALTLMWSEVERAGRTS